MSCDPTQRRPPITRTILPTRNDAWGFFGTTFAAEAEPALAWDAASARVAAATDASPEGVRDFLDSRLGRHFADDVRNGLSGGATLEGAIETAIARWQGWRIDRRTAREQRIPAGLPYLTGWATHFHILDEMKGWPPWKPAPSASRSATCRRASTGGASASSWMRSRRACVKSAASTPTARPTA